MHLFICYIGPGRGMAFTATAECGAVTVRSRYGPFGLLVAPRRPRKSLRHYSTQSEKPSVIVFFLLELIVLFVFVIGY